MNTYSVYANDSYRGTYATENSARTRAIKLLGSVFITNAFVIEDATGEIIFSIFRQVIVNRRRA